MSLIRIETAKNLIELPIDDYVTFVGGDSGSGKSYLIRLISDLVDNPSNDDKFYNDAELIDNNFVVCSNEKEIGHIIDCKGKIIIVDRYDIYSELSKKKLWKKMSDFNNVWLIMSRYPDMPNYGYSNKSFKILRHSISNGILHLWLEYAK